MTVLSTSNAIVKLFSHSKDTLSIEQLEWFKGLSVPAETELINVTKNLESIAMIHGTAEQCNLPSSEDLSCILFGLSDQISNIVVLMQIAEEASHLVGERKAEIDKRKAAHKNQQA